MDQGLTTGTLRSSPARPESVVPEESPRVMPEQMLWVERRKDPRGLKRVQLARSAILLLWLAGSVAFAWTLYQVLSVETPTVLQLVFWCLSTACFAWVAVGSASALLGFFTLLLQRTTDTLELPPARATPGTRTALLFPVYREDAAAVAATVEAMCRDIAATNAGDRFDIFILSDTQDASERELEHSVYAELRA